MRSHRVITLLVTVALTAACGSSTSSVTPVGSNGADASPTARSTSDGSFDPVALAEAVTAAAADGDREQAINDALASIGIGVWTADGDPVRPGAERTSTDFIAYDFEVTALSDGLADGDQVYLDDIASELSIVNVAAGGTPFTAADFATAVTSATADAVAKPDRTAGYALRLARELGLRDSVPIDLADASTASTAPIALDPLAAFLVAADVALPRALAADPPAVAAIGDVASVEDTGWLTAADPCVKFRRQTGSNWYAGATQVPGTSGANASFSRSLQAQLLGGTVKVGGSYDKTWHHLHRGQPSKVRTYFVGLQVRVAVPRRINCGPIRFTNGQMQGGGAVVGAEVDWTHPGLEHHGQFDCQADCLRTDANGVAKLQVEPFTEPGPGGIGPELKATIPVTAEINLFKALGPDLLGVLNLPPDMRIFARKVMPTDITWHRGYNVSVSVDSQLYVNKAQAFEYKDHVGTVTASGVIDAATVRPANDVPSIPPKTDFLLTATRAGTGPLCSPGQVKAGGAGAQVLGSLTYKADNLAIPVLVIDAVIYPVEDLYLYLDVGPWDPFRNVPARLVQCDPRTGAIVTDYESPSTNLWEGTIFRGYPKGLSFSGAYISSAGPVSNTAENVWNVIASPRDWEGNSKFTLATWTSPQTCGGYCDSKQSWLKMTILVEPIPDP